jgi:hypothetical protein
MRIHEWRRLFKENTKSVTSEKDNERILAQKRGVPLQKNGKRKFVLPEIGFAKSVELGMKMGGAVHFPIDFGLENLGFHLFEQFAGLFVRQGGIQTNSGSRGIQAIDVKRFLRAGFHGMLLFFAPGGLVRACYDTNRKFRRSNEFPGPLYHNIPYQDFPGK